MLIKQHIAAFVDRRKALTAEYIDVKSLLNIGFVKKYSEEAGFYKYSLTENTIEHSDEIVLMAEFDNGKKWQVVGYLSDKIRLPEWKPK
jgi:6-phosphogluconolactonase/glucosamine-6-phosphate isomerase/deaminase